MAARKWKSEQRKQQSLMIRQWQPWLQSTEARTVEGKVITSQNGFKSGMSKMLQELAKYLRQQKKRNQLTNLYRSPLKMWDFYLKIQI